MNILRPGETMNKMKQETAILRMTFLEYQPAQPILERLLKSGLSSATMHRGRMTEREAWYEFEITGSPQAIEAALHENHKRGGRLSALLTAVA